MKRIAYSFLLIFVLSTSSAFAQDKIMFGIVLNATKYQSFDGVIPLGGVEIGYYSWSHPSYGIQMLSFMPPLGFIDATLFTKIPIIASSYKVYIFAGPELITGISRYSYKISDEFALSGGIGLSHYLNKSTDFFIEAGYSYGLNYISGNIRLSFGILWGK